LACPDPTLDQQQVPNNLPRERLMEAVIPISSLSKDTAVLATTTHASNSPASTAEVAATINPNAHHANRDTMRSPPEALQVVADRFPYGSKR
jgi:hypothetical protein